MEIYKITNNVNKKIYIGKDVKCNKNYYGSGVYIKKAILKYGKENFTKEIIDICDNLKDLANKEKYWIDFYKKNNTLYNLTEGGDGGDTWSNNPNISLLKTKFYTSIIIDGVEYESITLASKKLNISRSHMRQRLKSYNYQNYLYKDNSINIKNNKFTFIDKFEGIRKQISINNIIYQSITEASKILNKTHEYILWRLQSKSYTDWCYITGENNKEIDTGPIKNKVVSVNGVIYESITKAAIGSGIDRENIKYRLKSKNYSNYYYIK